MSYLKVIAVGHLGRDPELRFLPNGQGVCNFNIATNRSYTNNNGEKVKEVTWLRVSTWGKLSETCNQYLKQGSKVLVEGYLKPDPETGSPRVFQRQDGTHGASYELTADRVVFMDSRGDEGGFQGSSEQQGEFAYSDESDVPF